MLGFFDIPKINADPALDKLEGGVSSLKTSTAKVNALLEANKLEKKHWDKLSKAEAGFQQALNRVDTLYPEHKRGMARGLSRQMGILALLAALGLIGSTLLLHVWVND